jgi:hypothetical protein
VAAIRFAGVNDGGLGIEISGAESTASSSVFQSTGRGGL